MNNNVFPAIICYLILVALFYLFSAIALITWKFAIAPLVIYLSNKNYQEKVIQQGLFYKQIKLVTSF